MCSSDILLWKLCFQGDRFGGALDAAARVFSHGVDSGQAPMEFVNDMRKKGQLIMGIGHRVKSVSTLPPPPPPPLMLIYGGHVLRTKRSRTKFFYCAHNSLSSRISLPL